ncbi:hypothetical protein RSAG8_07467, partial [Rhizoctonia solani AG-8 WAC10335]
MRANILASVLLALLPLAATTPVKEGDLGAGAENHVVDTIPSSSLSLRDGHILSFGWGEKKPEPSCSRNAAPTGAAASKATTASRSQTSLAAAAAATARPMAFDRLSKLIDGPGEARDGVWRVVAVQTLSTARIVFP